MPTVRLQFPGGRYHATPWGHHVNEGLIEWPPSPWRLLRAFIACGFSSQQWSEIPPVARRLIDKLAAVLPSYRLPPASAAHSRHYMPYIEGKAQKTTLVFDTWADVEHGELLIHWPCELDPEEWAMLDQLVGALGYLGRSESWVEGQLIADGSGEWNAVPCLEHEHHGPGWEQVSLKAALLPDVQSRDDRQSVRWEQVSLMAALLPADYAHWRETQVQEVLQPFQGQKQTAAVKKKQAQAIEPYPPDLCACLTKDTVWWKGRGWSQPPGSQRVLYRRRSDALEVGVPIKPRRRTAPAVECMLLAITTPRGRRTDLPPVERTLPQAELFHQAVICRAANGQRINCPSLTGKDAENRPLLDGHAHAHTIPLDLNGDGRLDHLLLFAKMELCATAQRAIRGVNRTWTKGGVGDLQLAVVGSGRLKMLRQLPQCFKNQIELLLGPLEGACLWESVSPFVPPRYLKSHGKDTLENQVQAELVSRGLPPAKRVQIDQELTKRLRHFVRQRRHNKVRPKVDMGFGIQLQFSQPVPGPLLLGYASHYGLGQFRSKTN